MLDKRLASGIGSILVTGTALFSQQPPTYRTHGIGSVPDSIQFIDAWDQEKPEPWKVMLRWPAPAEIAARRVNGPSPAPSQVDPLLVQKAIDSTFEWLSRILKPEWVPDPSRVEVLALAGEAQGADVIKMRFQIDHYYFQIASIHPTIWIAVQDFQRNPEDLLKSQKIAADYLINQSGVFFKIDDSLSRSRVKEIKEGYRGYWIPPTSHNSIDSWRDISMWSDGSVFIAYTIKSLGGRTSPGEWPQWFSKPTGRRPRKALSDKKNDLRTDPKILNSSRN